MKECVEDVTGGCLKARWLPAVSPGCTVWEPLSVNSAMPHRENSIVTGDLEVKTTLAVDPDVPGRGGEVVRAGTDPGCGRLHLPGAAGEADLAWLGGFHLLQVVREGEGRGEHGDEGQGYERPEARMLRLVPKPSFAQSDVVQTENGASKLSPRPWPVNARSKS